MQSSGSPPRASVHSISSDQKPEMGAGAPLLFFFSYKSQQFESSYFTFFSRVLIVYNDWTKPNQLLQYGRRLRRRHTVRSQEASFNVWKWHQCYVMGQLSKNVWQQTEEKKIIKSFQICISPSPNCLVD